MNVKYSPGLVSRLKKNDVRIRKSFKEKLTIFCKNPNDPGLNNHSLREPYQDRRSIDITNDYRAHYKEIKEGTETVAYFISFGTHEELYRKRDRALVWKL